jgi:hypothetical protein
MNYSTILYYIILAGVAGKVIHSDNPFAAAIVGIGMLAFLGFNKFQQDKLEIAKQRKAEEFEQLIREMEALKQRMASVDSKFALSNSRKSI